MTLINLLPPSERQPKWALRRILLAISLAISIICAGIFMYGEYAIWKLERQIDEAHNQYELLKPTIEKMQEANNKKQQLDTKNNLLLQLTQERRPWYSIIARLGVVTPGQVWLTEVGMVDKHNLRMKGVAAGYPALADFMAKIEQDEILSQPTLIKAEHDRVVSFTRFEIMVKLKGL